MARPLWSGVISFGLVQIPVGMHSADRAARDSLKFTLLDEKDLSPVGYKHVNKSTGEEVPKERRVKGVEVADNEYVVVTEADFKAANPKASQTIDIVRFVDPESIPLLRYEKPYYLSPQKKGAKPYALLRDALRNTGKVAIATVVIRQRQHLVAVTPFEDALVMEVLRYDYELVPLEKANVLGDELKHVKVSHAEVQMAETLVKGMSGEFDTSDIKDTFHDDLVALIEERKAHPEKGHTPAPKKPKATGEVVDMMELLKRSVAAQQKPAADEDKPAAHRAHRTHRTDHRGKKHVAAHGVRRQA
jgi:DNA end-binding protein Ku